MDTDKKSVLLKTKADLVINSDLKVGLTKAGKTFENGKYTATASKYLYNYFKTLNCRLETSVSKITGLPKNSE